MRIVVLIVLSLFFSGCEILEELVPPSKPAILEVFVLAPEGRTARVTLEGSGVSKGFADDGRGFETRFELAAGTYTATAEALEGCDAFVRVTNREGNVTSSGRGTVKLEPGEAGVIKIQYVISSSVVKK
jgi:hypothetical protein